MRYNMLMVLVIAVFGSSSLLAETAYVQARKANILASPSLKSEVISVARKGDSVEIQAKQGRWLKIRYGKVSGWVSKLLVNSKPPAGKVTVLQNDSSELSDTARRRASAATAAAAARGLRGDERSRQSDEGVADFSAVRQMENINVSEDEAIEFLEQGVDE